MDIPNYDQEIERQHEPAVVLADPPEPDMFGDLTYPRSECCNAAMAGGVQCINCGSYGKIQQ